LQVVRQKWEFVPIYGYFDAWILSYSLFLSSTRYRLPLDFFLVIFAFSLFWRNADPCTRDGPHRGTGSGDAAAANPLPAREEFSQDSIG
jgi:hypothetical protein